MNYLKLNLGGKERGAKLGLLFLENAQKAENKDVVGLFTEFQQRSIFFAPKLLYYALQTNCEMNGEIQDFTIENVYDWIEEDGINKPDGAMMTFINAFTESVKKLFPTDENIDDKAVGKSKKALTPTSGSKK